MLMLIFILLLLLFVPELVLSRPLTDIQGTHKEWTAKTDAQD